MEKIALLFPGQGSQFVGMGKNLLGFAQAGYFFEQADRLLPEAKLTKLCFEGPEDELRLTLNAQPAIFTVSMACYAVFKKQHLEVSFAAGHSVGEYGALAASGALSFADGLRLVRRRGELMYEAGLSRPGTMAAVLGLPAAEVEAICREASGEKKVEVANLNSPAQAVISGDPEAVEKASQLAKSRGAKRIVPLPVSGAFHSTLMEEAALLLSKELDPVQFNDPQFPVIANITGKPAGDRDAVRALLKEQIRGKVLWEESIRFMLNAGVHTFVEMDPGTVLSGLTRSIDKTAKTLKLEQMVAALEKT